MNRAPTEAEALQEIADIDALVREARTTLKKLEQRRSSLVPTSQATARRLAVAVHAVFCEQGHYEGACLFRKEAWDKWGGHRGSWVAKAKKRLEESGLGPEEFLDALRALASVKQRETMGDEWEEIAAVEREALEPKPEEEDAA